MQMQVNQRRRIDNEKMEAEQAKQLGELEFYDIVELEPKRDSYGVATLNWRMVFRGRELFAPGIYEVEIRIPENFPGVAPECYFLDKFEHVHVYEDGKVCMPMLDSKSWDPRISIIELSRALIAMVHSEPKTNNKANQKMADLYDKHEKAKKQNSKDQTDYQKTIKEQANRLKRETKKQGTTGKHSN